MKIFVDIKSKVIAGAVKQVVLLLVNTVSVNDSDSADLVIVDSVDKAMDLLIKGEPVVFQLVTDSKEIATGLLENPNFAGRFKIFKVLEIPNMLLEISKLSKE